MIIDIFPTEHDITCQTTVDDRLIRATGPSIDTAKAAILQELRTAFPHLRLSHYDIDYVYDAPDLSFNELMRLLIDRYGHRGPLAVRMGDSIFNVDCR